MNGPGILLLLSGLLQPGLGGYALRLNRVFGSRRVGWWLFAAFVCLALLHLTHSMPVVGISIGLLDVLISVLLLVGMAHTETFCARRIRREHKERKLQAELDRLTREGQELAAANENLLKQLLRREEREKTLSASEQQFRGIFAENPLPMWIFDLRSLRFLAVNQAALDQYGYTSTEWMGLAAKDLYATRDIPVFLQACAKPSSGAEPPRPWRHCRKDGTLLHVEVRTRDLRYDGCPARLVVAAKPARQSEG